MCLVSGYGEEGVGVCGVWRARSDSGELGCWVGVLGCWGYGGERRIKTLLLCGSF